MDIIHRLGVIRVEDSLDLDEWYDRYRQELWQPYYRRHDIRVRQAGHVQDDTLDMDQIDIDVELLKLTIHKSSHGNCAKCQAFMESIRAYTCEEIIDLPDEVIIPHYSSFCEWEASRRAGCNLCTLLFQAAMEFCLLSVHLESYQKIEARLLHLGKHSPPSLGLKFTIRGAMKGVQLLFMSVSGNDEVTSLLTVTAEEIHQLSSFSQADAPQPIETSLPDAFTPLDLAKQWLSACEETHGACSDNKSSQIPTRLLAIDEDSVKLVESARLGIVPRYATLSHCWGNLQFLRLTVERQRDFEVRIKSEDLTKTFQDAIFITRRLGLQFLWIDSLCIIQDSPKDWEIEASLMSTVYGNSTVNLVAASSRDGRDGCHFAPAGTCHAVRGENAAMGVVYKTCIRRPCSMFDFDVNKSHLASRAWCLQERILARRSIFFTRSGIFWECHSKTASEACPEGCNEENNLAKTQLLPDSWSSLVTTYAATNLSFGRDKLVALAGIAREVQSSSKDQYLAGMWRSSILDHLCWRPNDFLQSGGPVLQRPGLYRAPTWSWASLDCKLLYSMQPTTFARLIDAWTVPVGVDPFGQLCGGTLKIACEALLPSKIRQPIRQPSNKTELLATESLDCEYDEILEWPYLLPLTEGSHGIIQGLIIVQTIGVKGEFRRVGRFMCSSHRPDVCEVFRAAMAAGPALAASVCVEEDHDPKHPKQRFVITIV